MRFLVFLVVCGVELKNAIRGAYRPVYEHVCYVLLKSLPGVDRWPRRSGVLMLNPLPKILRDLPPALEQHPYKQKMQKDPRSKPAPDVG